MKEQRLQSHCPEQGEGRGLCLSGLAFLGNGPYSFNIPTGSTVGVTGKSGVGKSQLLRAVADVIPHDGDCFLEGKACSSFFPPDWRRIVAMLPAESSWWYDKVGHHFESSGSPLPSQEILGRLGFSADVMSWEVSRLSSGERQRLALLRTLVTRPQVLLLDEPTSALDKEMVGVVEKIVDDIRQENGCICLWVSHDLEQLFRVAERVLRVESSGFIALNEEGVCTSCP